MPSCGFPVHDYVCSGRGLRHHLHGFMYTHAKTTVIARMHAAGLATSYLRLMHDNLPATYGSKVHNILLQLRSTPRTQPWYGPATHHGG